MMQPDGNEIDTAAAQWLARLGGTPLSPAERVAFEDWIRRDAAHRVAFEEAQAAWASLGVLSVEPGALRGVLGRPARRRRAAASVALILVGLGLLRYQFGDPFLLWRADHLTGPGEIARVILPDGSEAELGPDSAIALAYGDGERMVRLLQGEVFFQALPRTDAEPRPFVVEAGEGRVTALGTQFQVDATPRGTAVTAIEHDIGVATAKISAEAVILTPGHQLRYAADRVGPMQEVDVAQALAWRDGVLVFDAVPLVEVVERLNRYRRGRIVIANAATGERLVSGVFQTSALGDVVDTITSELGLSAASLPPFVTLLY
jgi:transmembrane sensor